MLNFKKITENDFPLIDKYFALQLEEPTESRFCDYAPGTVKMWHEAYRMEYALCGSLMYLRAHYEEERGTSYLMPVGKWTENAFEPLFEYISTVPEATLSVVSEEKLSEVSRVFGVPRERFFYDRDWADYIYLREEFCNPSGKKHHKYKTNLNKFIKENPDYRVEALNCKNSEEALAFYERYCRENPETSSVEDEEYIATVPVIKDPKKYSMTGAVLKIGERIVGLTLGEVYGDTVIVHTEKAEKSVCGAYQTLAQGYQKMMPDDVVYINREEDMGLMGLRQSKNAYAPLRLEYKYTLHLK